MVFCVSVEAVLIALDRWEKIELDIFDYEF